MSKRRISLLAFLCLLAALPLQAQGSLRGRIFLPSGEPLAQTIRIILSSEDARFVPETYYTDGKGWFFLNRLRANQRYSVTVESDGETWTTTTTWFFAGRDNFITVMLLPLGSMVVVSKSSTVSVHQLLYKPRPEAKRAFEDGQKARAERNMDLARQKWRQAIELDPGYVSAYNDLAALEIDEKHYTEAEPLLRTAMEKDPEAVLVLLNYSIVLEHLGRYRDAIPILRKNLQLRPLWVAPKVYLGIALVETNQLEEAERLLLRGVATKSSGLQGALVYLYLGKLYSMKGDSEKAIWAWESYLSRDPDSSNAAEVRDQLARLRTPAKQP
jgi:tetratricopeptide (TPR) repeat protein